MSLSQLGVPTNPASSHACNTDNELARLASFVTWPTTAQISPIILARNGFVYDGIGERTRCVFCKLAVENWSREDSPAEVHRIRSPRCPFVVSKIAASATSPTGGLRGGMVTGGQTHTDIAWGETRGSSTVLTASSSVAETASSERHFSTVSAETSQDHGRLDRQNPEYDRLKTESVRVATFHDWPSRAADVVDPRELAAAGLFYTGQSDRVQCAFCRGFVRNWVQGDKPMEEHRKHFPDCPFVRGTDVGKLHFQNDIRLSFHLKEDNLATTDPCGSTSFKPTGRTRRPRHQEYADLSKRISSFSGGQPPRGQTVQELAAAGFFHVGPDDNVRCFQCDGGLKNWQQGDDPWTEHARWFPKCPFLLSTKDRSFIQNSQTSTDQLASQSRPTENAAPDSHQEAEELLEENRQLKESRTCKVCLDEEVNTVFLPCGHLVCCSNCSPALRHCAICRALIRGTVRIFLG